MRKIEKIKMAIGYLQMAELNLTIATEDFHLEDEGAKLGYDGEGDMEKSSQHS
jgi:hypothetical protein